MKLVLSQPRKRAAVSARASLNGHHSGKPASGNSPIVAAPPSTARARAQKTARDHIGARRHAIDRVVVKAAFHPVGAGERRDPEAAVAVAQDGMARRHAARAFELEIGGVAGSSRSWRSTTVVAPSPATPADASGGSARARMRHSAAAGSSSQKSRSRQPSQGARSLWP
jgi:hypothetical protein